MSANLTHEPIEGEHYTVTSETTGDGWEMVIGLEVHCELATATKLFCGCPNMFGDEPNTNVCPVCLGLPGSLPVLNDQAVELAMRLGPGPPLRRRAVGLRPEELLLSGHAEGLPGHPVRPADQRRRLARPPRRHPRRHRAGPHRGGHRQDHPRRRRRPHPRRRLLARRLQPRRRPAGGDRQPARHPPPRAGQGLRRRAARHPAGHRRDRRQDGGGLDARRRQRVVRPRRRPRAGHPLRDQEPQLAALARPGHRVRGPPPDRPARDGRARAAGDPPLGRGRRPHPPRAGRRRRRTTTATSRSPTSCRSAPAPSGSPRIDDALPVLPAARRTALAAAAGVGAHRDRRRRSPWSATSTPWRSPPSPPAATAHGC